MKQKHFVNKKKKQKKTSTALLANIGREKTALSKKKTLDKMSGWFTMKYKSSGSWHIIVHCTETMVYKKSLMIAKGGNQNP